MSMEKKERGKNNRKVKKEKNMRMKEWKKKKRKRKEEWQERYERDESSERKIKCKDVTLLRDETFTLIPTMCNPTTRMSSVPRSHNFLLPLHMSTIQNLLILDIPTYGLFSWSLALKGKQTLEEVLSLTIFVLIALALHIAPLYMSYERFMGGESFIKFV
jgi:hypothetical protein